MIAHLGIYSLPIGWVQLTCHTQQSPEVTIGDFQLIGYVLSVVTGRIAPYCLLYLHLIDISFERHAHGRDRALSRAQLSHRKSLHSAGFAPELSEILKRADTDLVSYVMPVRGTSSARSDLPGAARRMNDIIATFRSFTLSVDEDEGELGEIGERRTYLGLAGHTSHVAHVVETHDVYDSK